MLMACSVPKAHTSLRHGELCRPASPLSSRAEPALCSGGVTPANAAYCSRRSSALPARLLSSFLSSVPSPSLSAALKRFSTIARYSSLSMVLSLSGSPSRMSFALKTPPSSLRSRVSSWSRSSASNLAAAAFLASARSSVLSRSASHCWSTASAPPLALPCAAAAAGTSPITRNASRMLRSMWISPIGRRRSNSADTRSFPNGAGRRPQGRRRSSHKLDARASLARVQDPHAAGGLERQRRGTCAAARDPGGKRRCLLGHEELDHVRSGDEAHAARPKIIPAQVRAGLIEHRGPPALRRGEIRDCDGDRG